MAEKKNLSEYFIDNMKLDNGANIKEVYDTKIPAFCVRLTNTGRRSFILSGRIKGNPSVKRFSLGTFIEAKNYQGPEGEDFNPLADTPYLTLALARQKATAFLNVMKQGIDPTTQAKTKREKDKKHSFSAVVDAFLKFKHPDGKGSSEDRLRAKTYYDYERLLRGADLKDWQDRPITSITRADVKAVLNSIKSRGSHASARLTYAVLKSMFGWAREEDIITTSPTSDMKAPTKPASRDRALSDTELKIVYECADAAKHFAIPYKLLMLTGARTSEITDLQESEVKDLQTDKPYIEILKDRSKTKERYYIALEGEAINLMRKAINEKIKTSPFVFSTNGEVPINSDSDAKARLDEAINARVIELKAEAKARNDLVALDDLEKNCFVEKWRRHDLRRTVKTGMAKLGIPPHISDKATNHKDRLSEGQKTYNTYDYKIEARHALAQWGAHLTGLVNKPDQTAAILQFKK